MDINIELKGLLFLSFNILVIVFFKIFWLIIGEWIWLFFFVSLIYGKEIIIVKICWRKWVFCLLGSKDFKEKGIKVHVYISFFRKKGGI